MDPENEWRIFIRTLSGTAGNARLKADRFEAGFLFQQPPPKDRRSIADGSGAKEALGAVPR